MIKLYHYLLTRGYLLENYWGEKSFSFKKVNGDWSKSIYISKYSKEYEVNIIEGLSNIIKTRNIKVKTYKEVIELIKL